MYLLLIGQSYAKLDAWFYRTKRRRFCCACTQSPKNYEQIAWAARAETHQLQWTLCRKNNCCWFNLKKKWNQWLYQRSPMLVRVNNWRFREFHRWQSIKDSIINRKPSCNSPTVFARKERKLDCQISRRSAVVNRTRPTKVRQMPR